MTVEGRLKLGVRSEWIEVGCDERSSSRIGALVCSVVALGRRLACASGECVGAGMRLGLLWYRRLTCALGKVKLI